MKRFLLAGALCASCASTPYPTEGWQRADGSPDDLRKEAAQCRVQAMSASSNQRDGIVGYEMAKSIYHDCMLGKGWTGGERPRW